MFIFIVVLWCAGTINPAERVTGLYIQADLTMSVVHIYKLLIILTSNPFTHSPTIISTCIRFFNLEQVITNTSTFVKKFYV